jgi:hypothetical protein
MAVFLICAEDNSRPRDVSQLVDEAFPENYQFNRRCWVVAGKDLTTKKIARKLGIETDPEKETDVDGVVVFRLTPSYWGSASSELWDWLSANFE